MNRLANEPSLYLRQHAANPVDWFPWGDEAFAEARRRDKPLLVSIGYSACHWCHVMAHESFENNYIASLMNEHFVCVKVDREERPEVDQIYMEAVQMMHGHGGWPLHAFCLPDGRPFAGGTYFPPEDRGQGLVPWPQLLLRVSDFYQRQKGDLEENARSILHNLSASNKPYEADGSALSNTDLVAAAKALCETHDDNYGGFGAAPKFPPSGSLEFLLALRGSRAIEDGDKTFARRIDIVVNRTLTAMARGGLFDQIGGGFARYSVDAHWMIPHFEKMLYDNAQLISVYTQAWLRYPDPLYAAVVEESIAWIGREMRAPDGSFFSSLDADSEGEEGTFYLWTPAEIEAVLGSARAERFKAAYGVTSEGNFEGRNHLFLCCDLGTRASLAPMRTDLLEARSRRTPPGLDKKRLTAWNALVIKALAEAAYAFNNPLWMGWAKAGADWIIQTMQTPDGRLHSVYHDGHGARFQGTLDDYAFCAEAFIKLGGLIDTFESGASRTYIASAQALLEVVRTRFADSSGLGYFCTADDHESLICRKKEWFDNALPAAHSSLLHAFYLLHSFDADPHWLEAAENLRTAFPGIARRAPGAIGHALAAYTEQAKGIPVVKAKNASLAGLREALAQVPARPRLLLQTEEAAQPDGYQICLGAQCFPTLQDPTEVASRIA